MITFHVLESGSGWTLIASNDGDARSLADFDQLMVAETIVRLLRKLDPPEQADLWERATR